MQALFFWYVNQIKHVKVDGPPPGEELIAYSYSVREVAEMLSIDDSSIYYLIKRDQIPIFKVETWTRIRKKDFDKWYASQNKHRTQEDREKDAQMEAETLTMPKMARELCITRKAVGGTGAAGNRSESREKDPGDLGCGYAVPRD